VTGVTRPGRKIVTRVLNPFGETVAVRFEQVTDIHALDKPRDASIDDGTEVYMSLEAGSDMDSLRQRGQMRPKTGQVAKADLMYAAVAWAASRAHVWGPVCVDCLCSGGVPMRCEHDFDDGASFRAHQ
jgi:hypothetical protein